MVVVYPCALSTAFNHIAFLSTDDVTHTFYCVWHGDADLRHTLCRCVTSMAMKAVRHTLQYIVPEAVCDITGCNMMMLLWHQWCRPVCDISSTHMAQWHTRGTAVVSCCPPSGTCCHWCRPCRHTHTRTIKLIPLSLSICHYHSGFNLVIALMSLALSPSLSMSMSMSPI